MDVKEKFISDFKTYLMNLSNKQTGNFVNVLDEQIQHPTEIFLHLLCRKIDIKKNLFVDYDDKQDLKPLRQEMLDNSGWLKSIYILSYFFLSSQNNSITYKALNSLLKARDFMPKNCLENSFVQIIYKEFIKEIL